MKFKNTNKNYGAFGFVEIVIAIGVAGIALVVLMSMAANSMKEAVRYERQDALTRLTQNGALVVRKHVEDANHPDREEFESVEFGGARGFCYGIDFEEQRVLFTETYSNDPLFLEKEKELQVDIIYDYDQSEEENHRKDVYFAAYCITNIEGSPENFDTYVGSVIAGYIDCDSCGVKPYEHHIIVNVRKE